MRLQPRTLEEFGPPGLHAWLASSTGTNDAKTIVLDKDAFTAIYSDKVVKAGTILGEITASKRYGPYDNGASDGTQTAVFVLLEDTDVSGGHSPAAGMWHGQIWKSKLPKQSGAGSLDSGGITDLKLFSVLA